MTMTNDADLGLADALGAELDKAMGKEPAQEAPDDPIEGEAAPAAERHRDEAGRFAKKQDEPDAAELQARAKAVGEAQQQATPAQKAAWRANWLKPEHGVDWDKLPESFRNALRDQERAAQQGIEKHSTAAKAWEPVAEALKPFENELRLSGQTQQQFVGGLLNIYQGLQGEQTALQTINWLIGQRFPGYDLMSLADWMYQSGTQIQKPDPVQQELQALKQQVQHLSQLPQRQASEALSKQITDWSNGKTDFDAVRPLMAAFAKQNPNATLDELYEQARWAHPETRDRLLQEREDKRLAELKDKRQAGAQSPRPNGAEGVQVRKSNKHRSTEDQVAEAMDELGF